MTKKYLETNRDHSKKSAPATTPEGREQQLVSLAYDLAETRMRNGTASAQEVTHFLKAGSVNARLEREILKGQRDLTNAKTESIQSQKRVEELYAEALTAMRRYSGSPAEDFNYED